MKLAILLTATIKPNVVGGNFSIEERKEMYASTLRFYAKNIGKKYPIVFCENSTYNLQPLKDEFANRLKIEWLQFPLPANFMPQMGKGYNEYLMINKAMHVSNALRSATHFLKITGRYSMINIQTMIHEIEKRCTNETYFMGDVKDTNIYKLLGSHRTAHWGDSRFFVAQIDWYKREMIDCYREMCDYQEGRWAEHYILNLSRKHRKEKNFIFRFRHQVQFDGVSGTVNSAQLATGIKGQDSPAMRTKNFIRFVLRSLFPNIWF